MAIAIQCPGCKRGYNVDDKLAGRSVKCKGCGAAIPVAAASAPPATAAAGLPPEPDIFGVDLGTPPPTHASALPLGAPSKYVAAPPGRSPGVAQKCPSCGAPLAEASRICLRCGLNLLTGQRAEPVGSGPPLDLADPDDSKKRRKRYVRKRGNVLLEQLDELAKLVLLLFSIAGVVMWIVQIAKSPTGLSAGSLAPVALVLFLLAAMLGPLTAIGINVVVTKFNFVPRNDTYARVVLTLLFPFSMALLFGWASLEARFGGFVTLAWLITPALLVYMLRGEPLEWVLSLGTTFVTISVGMLVAGLIASLIEQGAGQMNADALPGSGPWKSLASGHNRVPTTQPQIAETAPATGPTTTVAVVPTTPTTPTGPTAPGVDAVTPTPIAAAGTTQPAPPTATQEAPKTPVAVAAKKISSPFFSLVVEEPALAGVSDVVVSSPSSPYFIAIKNGETETTVERWSISPLEKKGTMTFPYFAAKPSVFALSPRGDVLVTMVSFPRPQIELSFFDGKTPKKIRTLESLKVTPSLVGFVDNTRFAIRGDFDSPAPVRTEFEMDSATTGQAIRIIRMVPQIVQEPNQLVIGPTARYIAGLGTDRMIGVYNAENGQGLKLIAISNNLAFRPVQLTFSPDGNQLAAYAVVSDVATVMAFKVPGGEPTSTGVVAKKPRFMGAELGPGRRGARADDKGGRSDELLWLQNGKYWLVNGNEFIDVTSGRHIGTLDVEDVVDQHLLGTDSIVFEQAGANNTRNLIIAKFDEAALKAAATK